MRPGSESSRGCRGAARATARIRGGDPNFSFVLIDGVPLNDSTDSLGGSAPLGGLFLLDLDRVEVVRGSVSSVYGSSGLAGAIQLLSRDEGAARLGLEGALGQNSLRHVGVSGGGSAGDGSSLGGTLLYRNEEERVEADSFEQFMAAFRSRHSFRGGREELRLRMRGGDWRRATTRRVQVELVWEVGTPARRVRTS